MKTKQARTRVRMSATTDAIEIIDHLQTDGISRETAKELIDFVGLYDTHMSSTTSLLLECLTR